MRWLRRLGSTVAVYVAIAPFLAALAALALYDRLRYGRDRRRID